MKSTFPLHVPQSFYDLVCEAAGQFLADALLYGATLHGDELTFRTVSAYRKARDEPEFMEFATGMGLKLICPEPFMGKDERPTAKQAATYQRANAYE